jgi:hypothetical protein
VDSAVDAGEAGALALSVTTGGVGLLALLSRVELLRIDRLTTVLENASLCCLRGGITDG